MKVPAWSFSSLDTFMSCKRKYHEERVLKTVEQGETEAQRMGTWVHLQFENRIKSKTPLPAELAEHEPFMQEIEAKPGALYCERKVGLNKRLEPCEFFDKDVWWRGVLDVHADTGPGKRHSVVDYKTGKQHNKMRQLHLFAVWCFLAGASEVETMFYWTKTGARTRIILPRAQLDPIMRSLVPDLEEYKTAFKLDLWPPKPNGLCQNYCGVTECEHFGKRNGGRG